ncbi:MAG: hypothetical protein FWF29_03790 [Treponema sp.]|nr:hypothetical protein [Treponema sp.]
MRKIPLFFFFCAIFAFSNRLAAQEIKFSGTFNTGVLVTIPEKGETDVRLETDDGFGPTSARLRVYGTLEKEYWGLQFRLQTNLNTDYQYVFEDNDQFAYVWAAFFQDRMRIYAGKLAWGIWCTPFENNWSLDAQTGIRFEIKPVNGLNFGVTFKIPPRNMPDLGKYTLKRVLNEAIAGARWNNRLFSITGAFAFDGWDNYRRDEQAAILGFEFRGIPKLWTGLESRFQNITSGNMEFNLMEKFGYPVNDLTYAMLRIYQDGKTADKRTAVRFNPEANMHITGRILAACEAEFGYVMSDLANSWWLGIKPKLLLNLREGSDITAYYYGRFVNGGYSALNVSFEFYF